MDNFIKKELFLNNDASNLTNLIVNYIPDRMTLEEVKSLFLSIGEIESCRLVRNKKTGEHFGYGFVNYVTPEFALKAVERLNGIRLQNKILKVSVARPSSDLIKGANLFVSGLPLSLTLSELNELFIPFGEIVSSRILYSSNTGLSKGTGFVRFNLKSEAEAARAKLNGFMPLGFSNKIRVKFPMVSNKKKYQFNNKYNMMQNNLLGVGFSNMVPSQVHPSLSTNHTMRKHSLNHMAFNPVSLKMSNSRYMNPTVLASPNSIIGGISLFIDNLSPDTDEKFLWELFGPYGAVQSIRVVRDLLTHKCQGFGFVTMKHYEEALLAQVQLNGVLFACQNRPLHISF